MRFSICLFCLFAGLSKPWSCRHYSATWENCMDTSKQWDVSRTLDDNWEITGSATSKDTRVSVPKVMWLCQMLRKSTVTINTVVKPSFNDVKRSVKSLQKKKKKEKTSQTHSNFLLFWSDFILSSMSLLFHTNQSNGINLLTLKSWCHWLINTECIVISSATSAVSYSQKSWRNHVEPCPPAMWDKMETFSVNKTRTSKSILHKLLNPTITWDGTVVYQQRAEYQIPHGNISPLPLPTLANRSAAAATVSPQSSADIESPRNRGGRKGRKSSSFWALSMMDPPGLGTV